MKPIPLTVEFISYKGIDLIRVKERVLTINLTPKYEHAQLAYLICEICNKQMVQEVCRTETLDAYPGAYPCSVKGFIDYPEAPNLITLEAPIECPNCKAIWSVNKNIMELLP